MALEISGIRYEAENLGSFLAGVARANTAIDGIGAHTQRAASEVSAAQQIIIGGLREIGASAVELSATLGRELVQGIGSSISAAGDFGATLNRFSAVTGDALAESGQDIQDFNDLFLKLGADTQYSAQEAAEAGVNLAKGGIEPATIAAGGLTAALTLAAAGELDLAQAAEISAKQYGVWTREMTSAADKAAFLSQAADRLAQAANASTVGVPELAIGLGQVGEVARGVGYDFDETVTTMGLLAPAFHSASDGATSWKAVINNLIPTTKDAISVATELGLYTKESGSAFFDAEGNFIGAREAMQLLNDATKNLSEEQRILALETLFGADGQRAASILAAEGAAGYDRMAASMEAAGTAQEQAAARQVGWNFATEQLSGSLETFSIVLGQKLIPYLIPFVELATQGINVLSAFAQGSDDAGTQLYGFVHAIDEIIPGFQNFFYQAQDTLSWLGDLAVDAYNYGAGIAASFAEGIASAVSFVADALGAIGDTISYWLEPHSPPKIVPDLDRWGADAINVYLEGWTKGDFSIFESIGSLISSELRGIAEMAGSSIPRDGLIPMILGTRSAVAAAIDQLQETGEIGEEAYQRIRDAAGPAGETIAAMLELLVEQVDLTEQVEAAQAEYNAVVEEYSQRLDDLKAQRDAVNESYENTPVDQAIAANEEQQRAIRDAEKRAKLQETINDTSKSDNERRRAQLELERMALEDQQRAEEKARDEALAGIDQQIAATEAERDTVVSAAQTKLDEAKAAKAAIDEEVAARQSMIKVQQDQNSLVREQIQLLERMAKEAEQAAKAAARAGKAGGAKGGAKPKKPTGGGRAPTPKAPKAPIIGRPQGAPKIGGAGEDIPGSPAETFKRIADGAQRAKDMTALAVEEIVVQKDRALAVFGEFGIGTGQILAGIGAVVASIVVPALVSATGAAIAFAAPLVAIGVAGAALYTAWQTNFLGIQDVTNVVFAGIGATISTFIDNFSTAREAGFSFLDSLSIGLTAAGGIFENVLPGMAEAVGAFAWRALELAGGLVVKFGAYMLDMAQQAQDWVIDAFPGFAANLGLYTGKFIGWAMTFIADAVVWLGKAAVKFYEWVDTGVMPNLPTYMLKISEGIGNFLEGLIAGLSPYMIDLGLRFLTWVDDHVMPYLLTELAKIYTGIRDWAIGSLAGIGMAAMRIGDSIVSGIRSGISAGWGRFVDWINSKINEIPAAIREALGIGSPSKVIASIVEWIPKTAIMVFEDYAPILRRSVADLFNIASGLGSFSSKIVDRYKQQFIDPLQRLIDQAKEDAESFDSQISNVDSERADLLKAIAGATTDSQRDIGQRRLAELEQRRNRLIEQQTAAQKRQTDLQQQMIMHQKRLFALEKQRADMDFLKSQQDLLDMINKYGLDPKSILGDIQLGIGTPVEQLMEAMRRAQQAILDQMGLNFGGGPINAFSMAGGAMMPALTNPPGHNAPIINNHGNTIVYNIDARGSNWTEAKFQQMIDRTINAGVQGARTRITMNA